MLLQKEKKTRKIHPLNDYEGNQLMKAFKRREMTVRGG